MPRSFCRSVNEKKFPGKSGSTLTLFMLFSLLLNGCGGRGAINHDYTFYDPDPAMHSFVDPFYEVDGFDGFYYEAPPKGRTGD